jgi:hypothetical protein
LKYNYFHQVDCRVNLLDINGSANHDRLEAILNQQEFMKAIRSGTKLAKYRNGPKNVKSHYQTLNNQQSSRLQVGQLGQRVATNETLDFDAANVHPFTSRKKNESITVAFGSSDAYNKKFGKFHHAKDLITHRMINEQSKTSFPDIGYRQLKGSLNKIAPGGKRATTNTR